MRGAFSRCSSVCVCSLGSLEEFGVLKISEWVGHWQFCGGLVGQAWAGMDGTAVLYFGLDELIE